MCQCVIDLNIVVCSRPFWQPFLPVLVGIIAMFVCLAFKVVTHIYSYSLRYMVECTLHVLSCTMQTVSMQCGGFVED